MRQWKTEDDYSLMQKSQRKCFSDVSTFAVDQNNIVHRNALPTHKSSSPVEMLYNLNITYVPPAVLHTELVVDNHLCTAFAKTRAI